jgi:hypothetical protein
MVVVVAMSYETYGLASREWRLAPELKEALAAERPLNIAVTLSFPPEQFHIRALQRYGTMGGVRGDRVIVRRVTPENVRALGKAYWIDRIDLEHVQRSPIRSGIPGSNSRSKA